MTVHSHMMDNLDNGVQQRGAETEMSAASGGRSSPVRAGARSLRSDADVGATTTSTLSRLIHQAPTMERPNSVRAAQITIK